ncbi:RDD family protein [Streptomyces hoynatensis]|uniref:RDD family protein n=1 Tax=Streptomyces hoynatensis TaxID=1141874 RepID=A0A3A9YVR3_9ACTN|nr:RDD family protein [Streptomyces hoynatensis]RKN39859.1 RDD family protein [Streptomyces hoynatensis]
MTSDQPPEGEGGPEGRAGGPGAPRGEGGPGSPRGEGGPGAPEPGAGLPKAPPPGESGEPGGRGPEGEARGEGGPLPGMPPLASRGRRLLARIIDSFVVGIPVSLALWPTWGDWDTDNTDAAGVGPFVQETVILVVYFLYEALMLSARGQTLGKMALRIRVAMLHDGAVPRGGPGWTRAAVYSLPQVLPCIGFVFWLVNVLNCTWDKPYRQCLHDKAARTVVVSTA